MARTQEDAENAAVSVFARTMREPARPFSVVPFPGRAGARVAIVCPTEEENTIADVESRKRLTKYHGLSALELTLAQDSELARREREIELLAQVLRNADNADETLFESADEARREITGKQREQLIGAVRNFERERFESHTPEESDEIVRHVLGLKAVGALSGYWMSCDSDSQLSIVLALVDRCETPTAPSSSDT